MKKEYAKVSYFYLKAFSEWKNTISSLSKHIKTNASRGIEQFKEDCGNMIDELGDAANENDDPIEFLDHYFKSIYYGIKIIKSIIMIPIELITTITLATIPSLIHLSIVLTMAMIYLVFHIIVYSFDTIYRKIRHMSTQCPNCHINNDLPIYVCSCGAKHYRLIPSRYGIFRRKCNCGRILKTTEISGRFKQKGKWVCKKCGYQLRASSQSSVTIPVVGGKNSGKTSFIISSLTKISNNSVKDYKLKFGLIDQTQSADDYLKMKDILESGMMLPETINHQMVYYQFNLTPQRKKFKNLISLCDVPGSVFEESSLLINQLGLTNTKSIILLIDPLSIPKFREKVFKNLTYRYKSSTFTPGSSIYSLINALQSMNFEINNKTKKFDLDIAIVFTKVDFGPINDRIGKDAVKLYRKSNSLKSNFKALNQFCRDFLFEYGEDNFYNALKTNFQNFQFFICSSLGSASRYRTDKVINVDHIIYWAISNACSDIKIKKQIDQKMVVSELFDFDESD